MHNKLFCAWWQIKVASWIFAWFAWAILLSAIPLKVRCKICFLAHELFFSQRVASPLGTEYALFSLKLNHHGWILVSFGQVTPSIINSWWLIWFGSWWIGPGLDLRIFMLFLGLVELLAFLFNADNCSWPFWFRKIVLMSVVWLNIFSAYLYLSV